MNDSPSLFGWVVGGVFLSVYYFGLQAFNNLENMIFGKGFQAKVFPEGGEGLLGGVLPEGVGLQEGISPIHRVCVTTCFIFSLVDLYYVNKISSGMYQSMTPRNGARPTFLSQWTAHVTGHYH
ncbi:PREDICTED: keratinocyte-associated protein 2 [Nanorana parkeri]|uniref:keratinocyte-associated protein 2 n=1 Tax=Nanorana parkeri TaxID=125878 RepID=UPI000854BB06|nr:PREDICTED: keratinocyte-associated protein 2 [Nanorana parkeri]